ncbi:hypothetical protein FRC12_011538 [Ceratobasidium sp. 428]|nr:hypothetical protein FRC12_011538 [Ceratobasidium sp. 428]
MFSDNFNDMRVYSSSNQTLTGGIFDSIEALDQRTFTVLEIARLAAKYKMLPSRHYHFWHMAATPPYTVGLGDFGYIIDQNPKAVWNPIALKQAADVEVCIQLHCSHHPDRVLINVIHSRGILRVSAVAPTMDTHSGRAISGLVLLCTIASTTGSGGGARKLNLVVNPAVFAMSGQGKREHFYAIMECG